MPNLEAMAEVHQNTMGPQPWHGLSKAEQQKRIRAMGNALLLDSRSADMATEPPPPHDDCAMRAAREIADQVRNDIVAIVRVLGVSEDRLNVAAVNPSTQADVSFAIVIRRHADAEIARLTAQVKELERHNQILCGELKSAALSIGRSPPENIQQAASALESAEARCAKMRAALEKYKAFNPLAKFAERASYTQNEGKELAKLQELIDEALAEPPR